MKTTLRFLLILLLLTGGISTGQAQQKVRDSLRRVMRATKADTVKINAANSLSHEFREENPDSAITYATDAMAKSKRIHYDFGLANAHMNLGNAMVILSRYAEALKHFEMAKHSFEKQLNSSGSARSNHIKKELARAYGSLGVVYSEQNNYAEALQQYFGALRLYREIGDKSGIAKVCNNIGIVYKSQDHLPQALDYLSKAEKIEEETGEASAPVTLTNIGAIYFGQHKNTLAFSYYMRAQKLFATSDNTRGEALLYSYLGDYFQISDAAKSEQHYQRSLQLYRGLGNKFGESLVQYHLGELNYRKKQYPAALASAEASLKLAKEIATPDQVKFSEKLISDICTASGDPAKALVHFREYVRVKDSLENEESTRKFVRAEMDSEYKKREALMQEKVKSRRQLTTFLIIGGLLALTLIFVLYNRRQVKRRLTLEKEVAEYEQKALHLQMNPHFVFNCLGSISSFIVQNGTDSAIKYLSKFSKLMRLTLEYSKATLIPLDKEIEGLRNYLELEQLRFNGKFEFSIEVSEHVEDDLALPPLLIQPFVENAILHGLVPKDGNGRIDITFDVADNKLACIITDDGIGFQRSKALKENSVTAHESSALEITKKRLDIMETATGKPASVSIAELKNTHGKLSGTRITLSLPVQYISDIKNRI